MAPVIEVLGLGYSIFLLASGKLNLVFFMLLLAGVYSFALFISFYAIYTDLRTYDLNKNPGDQWKLVKASAVEALTFHPFIVFHSICGNKDIIFRVKRTGDRCQVPAFRKKNPKKNLPMKYSCFLKKQI